MAYHKGTKVLESDGGFGTVYESDGGFRHPMRTFGADESPTPLLDEPIVKAGLTGAGIYHGYKRTGSILWALFYGLAARTAPVVTGGIVAAQGFGKKKES